ncbi:MAG: NlpC/P60 family protein [Chitinophagaceae bacterium]
MKNPFLFLLVSVSVASCSSSKRSTGTQSAAGSNTRQASSSPVFLDNITLNPSGNQQKSAYSVQPAYAGENNGVGVENSSALQFKYAILMDIPVEEVADMQLIQFIEGWYGTRYRYGGNDKNGIDCSAFAQTLQSAIYSIKLPRTSAEQYNQCTRIRRDEIRQGDLVFFATLGRKKSVSHVGVYLRNNKFVHASTSGGVMIDDLNSTYYSSHFVGAGRMK